MLNFEICVLVFGVFAFVTTVSFKRFISSVVQKVWFSKRQGVSRKIFWPAQFLSFEC